MPFELIYIIDGTDDSFKILKDIQKSKNNLILDYSPKLRGFKNAFAKGFKLVSKNATHILTLDGDLNHQPEEIRTFLTAMDNTNADLVIGSRYVKQGKIGKIAFWKKAISVVANFVIKTYWGIKIRDKTSGFRLYKKKVIDRVVPLCKSNNFEVLFEIIINTTRQGYKIIEVPIHFKPRKGGESKFQLWKVIKGYIKLMIRYH
jgi:dolichol-phosphate mannosyltransferase